ncbi:MAG: polyprenyl synthetase family protein [Patescibacteria group bacterium]
MQDIEVMLKQFQHSFESVLKKSYRSMLKTHPFLKKDEYDYARVTEAFLMRPSKRIRPFLVSFVAPWQRRDVQNVAIGIELIHTSLLVHDDIIDESPKRRGGRAMHIEVGAKQALVVGDFYWAMGLYFLSKADLSGQIMREYLESLIRCAQGQIFDIEASKKKTILSKDLFTLYECKTAGYSVGAPLAISAMLARRPRREVEAYRKIGLHIGVLFQLQDDILDHDVLLTKANINTKDQKIKLVDTVRSMITDAKLPKKQTQLLLLFVEYVADRSL